MGLFGSKEGPEEEGIVPWWLRLDKALLSQAEETEDPPEWGDDGDLPAWAYRGEIRDFNQYLKKCGLPVPPLSFTCGPGIKRAFGGLINYWAYAVLQPYMVYGLATCSVGGLAQAPAGPMLGLLACAAALAFWFQWQCMGFALLPQLAVTGKFKVNRGRCRLWFMFMFVSTTLTLTDSMTNGMVVAKALATEQCGNCTNITDAWDSALEKSIIQNIPIHSGASFGQVALLAYALLFAQVVFALLHSVPGQCGVSYGMSYHDRDKYYYRTLCFRPTDHGRVLQVLAQGAHMEALIFQYFAYAKCQMESLLKEAEEDEEEEEVDEDDEEYEWELRYLHAVDRELSCGITRFWLVGVLQTYVQLYLQVLLATAAAEASGAVDMQMVLSIAVSILASVLLACETYQVIKLGLQARKDIDTDHVETHAEDTDYYQKLTLMCSVVASKHFRFKLYLALYVVVVAWATAKLAGLFACPTHVWNVTGCLE